MEVSRRLSSVFHGSTQESTAALVFVSRPRTIQKTNPSPALLSGRSRCPTLPRHLPLAVNLIRVLRCQAINRRHRGYKIFPLLNPFRQSVKLAEVYSWMAEHFVSVDCRPGRTWNSHREPSLRKLTLQKRLPYVVTVQRSSFHHFDFIGDGATGLCCLSFGVSRRTYLATISGLTRPGRLAIVDIMTRL